jgi:hypothetical protein
VLREWKQVTRTWRIVALRIQSFAWTVGISREMDERGCKQLQAEVDGLLGISKHAVKPKSLFINAPFAQSLRPILASNPCVQRGHRRGGPGGGRNNVMRQLRRHAIGED